MSEDDAVVVRERKPDVTIQVRIYDRDIEIEGKGMEKLRNSTLNSLLIKLKKEARIAKRMVLRQNRGVEDSEPQPNVPSPESAVASTEVDASGPVAQEGANVLERLGITLKQTDEDKE